MIIIIMRGSAEQSERESWRHRCREERTPTPTLVELTGTPKLQTRKPRTKIL